ncbi:hypothetical protein O6H91_15G075000 [Diphasiastrum complanatum]|uniref:Uncharacterized protein n=1 Tax=Diphasiastrum complanatum TaxID=34168 RepID=A0ACC2BJS9_DIPCM|nr:hypothetical protein O6H91_15G075000 [Diphasiastrum complanatum]
MAAAVVLRRSSRLALIATNEETIVIPKKGVTSREMKNSREKCRTRYIPVGADVQEKESIELEDMVNDERRSQEGSEIDTMEQEPITFASTKRLKLKAATAPQKSLKKLPSRNMEAELWEMGFRHVAGVDEAGRGPLAGPVVAAACIIPSNVSIEGINDSKKLNQGRREELYNMIVSTPGVAYAVHVIDAAMIDQINILQATMLAMTGCINKLSAATGASWPDFILVDGNRLPDDLPDGKAQFVIKGDAECFVIAAASILAKVTRDRIMMEYDKKWPQYGFGSHKGYGTVAHMTALLKYGPCDIHRRSFAPLKDQDILKGVSFP